MDTDQASETNESDRLLQEGVAIPAHPLALDERRRLDERRQRALTRYYLDAGAGGIAVAVHTTQFEIREVGLLEPVLQLAAEEASRAQRPLVKVAGVVGRTRQAAGEAELARSLGYDYALVSLAALGTASNEELLEHLRAIGDVIPVFAFYLQPAVGGRRLDYRFWREAVDLPSLRAIKVAPFDRYETLAVARALWDARAEERVNLYTGNDDTIAHDLLSEYVFEEGSERRVRFRGGLLGQWAVWTRKAVALLEQAKRARSGDAAALADLLRVAPRLTDANGVLFDAAHGFAGCICGINEILRRQGLLAGNWTLNPAERLSPGQSEEIDRIQAAYPELQDDAFVSERLDEWLR